MYKKEIILVTISALLGALIAVLIGSTYVKRIEGERNNQLVKDFFDTQNLVSASPHGMRLKMDAGKFEAVLVDLRSAEEYETGHITGAINIPAYKDKNTPDYGAVDRILGAFEKIPKGKEIITYCYSSACMTSRKVGQILSDHNIYVKHLNIGWNEWKNDWRSWNHEHEWISTAPWQYITFGKEPGIIKISESNTETKGCPADGFGC